MKMFLQKLFMVSFSLTTIESEEYTGVKYKTTETCFDKFAKNPAMANTKPNVYGIGSI